MVSLFENLVNKDEKISVIGLGYVGMPIAVAFSRVLNVIGFDTNKEKIKSYKSGKDPTKEVGDDVISSSSVEFTDDENRIKEALFHIIAVPTPINLDKTPNLFPVTSASSIVGKQLRKGSVVVFESTVYPGVTEDVCIPILEQTSGLKCGRDFKVGYSPERINPGDKVNRLETIVKIVSGIDDDSVEIISKVYELIISAGIHKASSIKVAEAAKVVENSQRDINIAFMNELSMVFDKMGIDTMSVIDAMNTKWNALRFYPGLVGGHCIGVDPYYFLYEAEKLGYHSQIILSGRKINDSMSEFIANSVIKKLALANKIISQAKVIIFGITFKENCPDIRNSKVVDIVSRLNEYGVTPLITDPYVAKEDVLKEYNIEITEFEEIEEIDCAIFAVPHNKYRSLQLLDFEKMFRSDIQQKEKIIIDVKGMFNREKLLNAGYSYWRL